MKISGLVRPALTLLRTGLLAFALILVGCGGGSGTPSTGTGGMPPAPTDPAPVQPPGASVTRELGPAGGTLGLDQAVTATIPPDLLAAPSAITLRTLQSDDLDLEFSNGTDVFDLVDWEDNHVLLSGFPSNPATPAEIEVKVQLSAELAGKVGSSTTVAGIVWLLDRGQDEAAESLASHEVVPTTYDPSTRIATMRIASAFLSNIDPVGHQAGNSGYQLTIRVGLFDTGPAPTSARVRGAQRFDSPSRLAAATSAPPACGTAEWTNPIGEYRSVASFGEIRENATLGHGGLDLVTRNASNVVVTGIPAVAVAAGTVEIVRSEACGFTKASKNRPSRLVCSNSANPGYSLTLKLDNGDRVVYRHLMPGGISLAGLKDEPNIDKYWKDDGKKRYRVAKGAALALTGQSGNVAPHLHLEYAAKIPGTPSARNNPLCKLAKVVSEPPSGVMKVGETLKVKSKLTDGDGKEYLIRRRKSLEVFLSGTAVPRPPAEFPADSRSIMVRIDRFLSTPGIVAYDTAFVEPSAILASNNGVEQVRAMQPGETSLVFKPAVPWLRDGTMTPFGQPIIVPVVVGNNAPVAILPIWKKLSYQPLTVECILASGKVGSGTLLLEPSGLFRTLGDVECLPLPVQGNPDQPTLGYVAIYTSVFGVFDVRFQDYFKVPTTFKAGSTDSSILLREHLRGYLRNLPKVHCIGSQDTHDQPVVIEFDGETLRYSGGLQMAVRIDAPVEYYQEVAAAGLAIDYDSPGGSLHIEWPVRGVFSNGVIHLSDKPESNFRCQFGLM